MITPENGSSLSIGQTQHDRRAKLSGEMRAGRIVRQPCEVCGGYGEAHHPDYTKPLDVQWLCKTHHMAMHRKYA